MSEETYPVELQAMIDRAGTLTAEQTNSLGTLWESGEDLVLPKPSIALELVGELDYPMVTNEALIAAWERALHAASNANPIRLDVIEAARAAGRAAKHDVRHLRDSESAKNGTEEAVRSAVLAVGVRDLIPDADYQVLVSPWQRVLGAI
jgi:hypothetical protein